MQILSAHDWSSLLDSSICNCFCLRREMFLRHAPIANSNGLCKWFKLRKRCTRGNCILHGGGMWNNKRKRNCQFNYNLDIETGNEFVDDTKQTDKHQVIEWFGGTWKLEKRGEAVGKKTCVLCSSAQQPQLGRWTTLNGRIRLISHLILVVYLRVTKQYVRRPCAYL